MARRDTTESFIDKAIARHGKGTWDYSQVVYKSNKVDVTIICKTHGPFQQRPNDHLSNGRGCPDCGLLLGIKKKTKTKEEFIVDAVAVHGDKYDYSKVVYTTALKKVEIIDKARGKSFWQTPANHLTGHGSVHERNEKFAEQYIMSEKEFVKKATDVHGRYKYDYSEVEYYGATEKVGITCHLHGKFYMRARDHINGKQGCPVCSRISGTKMITKNQQQFLIDANKIHGDRYDYSKVIYINNREKVTIICNEHNEFQQTPDAHINQANGCPHCSNRVSKGEKAWLDGLGVPLRQVDITLQGRSYSIDGYDPDTKTVYEYHGDYWHGNPKKFKPEEWNVRTNCTMAELYRRTLLKEQFIIAEGYNLVVIWEREWKYRKKT